MPKQKTHKGLSKRVKVTASGKVKHSRSFDGHLMSSKNAKRRRRIASATTMHPADAKRVKIMICKA
jgi:large subunit ribosomal protein L35